MERPPIEWLKTLRIEVLEKIGAYLIRTHNVDPRQLPEEDWGDWEWDENTNKYIGNPKR